jgi:hypothetical protein
MKLIQLGMIFDKGVNKVTIPHYLYRYTATYKNKPNFYLLTLSQDFLPFKFPQLFDTYSFLQNIVMETE